MGLSSGRLESGDLQVDQPLEIAERRDFSSITIEGHLAFYVEHRKLSIDAVMDVSKIPAIQQCIEKFDRMENLASLPLAPIKEQLGDNYTYGEIRMVMAHIKKSETQLS